jgi:hypothetical protein
LVSKVENFQSPEKTAGLKLKVEIFQSSEKGAGLKLKVEIFQSPESVKLFHMNAIGNID